MIEINCFEDISNDRINLIEMIVIFIMNDLDLHHDITININNMEEMGDDCGICASIDEIDICHDDTFDNLFKIIAHELRHVYQHVSGHLTDDMKWHGFKYDKLQYDELPWEIDANKYEEYAFNKMGLYKG